MLRGKSVTPEHWRTDYIDLRVGMVPIFIYVDLQDYRQPCIALGCMKTKSLDF